MKYKKAMVLEETVKLLVAAAILVVFAVIIIKVMIPPQSDTVNSFKTLGSEIKIITTDLDSTDKASIIVPVFIEKTYFIGSVNKDSANPPKKCEKESCLVLYVKATREPVNIINLGEVYIKQEDDIRALNDTIIRVNVTAEKIDSKKIITLQQIS
jgi:hypothetical protein